MKYLQLFESTRDPWTGTIRQFYILWSEHGELLDSGAGHPAISPDEQIVRLRPPLHVKIRDFERTVESKSSPA